MVKHLVRWNKEYGPKGLVVIDVDNGTQDSLKAVKEHVAKEKLQFPVLYDKGGKVCSFYKVRTYAHAFLIDVDGKVVWEGFPNPRDIHIQRFVTQEFIRERIEKELKKVKTEDLKKEEIKKE